MSISEVEFVAQNIFFYENISPECSINKNATATERRL